MIVSGAPIKLIDIFGSILMIVLAFACLYQVGKLKGKDPGNVIWTYLFWVCVALAGFAVSRSAGHLIKQLLLFSGRADVWEIIRPFSGSINTIMFMAVGSVTLYFERSWKIYERIVSDKKALQTAHKELMFLNRNLEKLVQERTKALVMSEHNYRRIFEVSRDMIFVTRRDGTIVDMNPAGQEMLGENATGFRAGERKIQDYIDNPEDWNRLNDLLEHQGFTSSDEIKLRTGDGSVRSALISSGLDKGDDEKEDIIHFLAKDIEQRKLMEQQLTQADKLASIGQLSAGIAHEINNPLGIILGYTQLLLRGENQETEKYQDLKTIEKHVRACKTIVEDLLNFARSSKPSLDVIRLNDSLEEVVSFIQHHSKLEEVEIHKEYDPSLPPMILDEKKIKQVAMNLIMNAKHAVGKQGRISLTTKYVPDSRQAVIEISDTGYGIEQKNLRRIFDPFFTTKPTGEGTGLGLSVSYGIVKNHGGDIFVDSENGKGATFTVVLPVNTG